MNRTILVCSVVLMVACMNVAMTFRSRTLDMIRQKESLIAQNSELTTQLKDKARFRKRTPRPIADAFSTVVNEINFVTNASGLDISLVFLTTRQDAPLESLCVTTAFRGVRGMPFDIKIVQATGAMDVGAALDLAYVLEHQTDFKISKIDQSGHEMKIQGMVYGL